MNADLTFWPVSDRAETLSYSLKYGVRIVAETSLETEVCSHLALFKIDPRYLTTLDHFSGACRVALICIVLFFSWNRYRRKSTSPLQRNFFNYEISLILTLWWSFPIFDYCSFIQTFIIPVQQLICKWRNLRLFLGKILINNTAPFLRIEQRFECPHRMFSQRCGEISTWIFVKINCKL